MDKSPRGLSSPKHCEGKRAARVGWAPSRSLSEPMSKVQRTSIAWTSMQDGVVGGCKTRSWRGTRCEGASLLATAKGKMAVSGTAT